MASRSSGTPWPSQRITIASFPMDSAGKFPSEITRRSLCPISQSTFKSSGDKIFGIPFNISCFLPVVIFSDRAAAPDSPSIHTKHTFYEVKALTGLLPIISRKGFVQSQDRPCCQRYTTGIRYPRLLLPHRLLPWSEGR